MKKLIVSAVIIPVLIMLFMPVNATEITVNSDESENILSEEEYIPEYVLEIIEANGADTQTYADYSVLVSFCLSVLKESVISYSDTFLNIMAIVFIMAIFKKINDNTSILMIASLVFPAAIARELLPEGFAVGTLRVEYRRAAVLGDVMIPEVARVPEGYVISFRDQEDNPFANLWMAEKREDE